ncbi:MAG: glycosyltransferase [Ruminococcaceae bacterium]|nr:glycosyltransferase [Oscillospiraceae bacterium]
MGEKVSVIVPVYNLEDYIDICMESIVKQSYQNLEIILINDGSLDNSLEKCKEWERKDSRVVVINQKNSGVSAARNAGLDAATGKYVTFVDGDDIISKNAISLLVGMYSESNIVLTMGKTTRISEYNYNFIEHSTVTDADNYKTVEKLLFEKIDMAVYNKLFLKEKTDSIRFVQGKKINEDKYFLFEYLLHSEGMVVSTKCELYGYFCRESSVTNEVFSPKYLDAIYFSEEIIKSLEKYKKDLLPLGHYNLMCSRFMVLKKIVRTKQVKQNKDLFIKIRKDILKAGIRKDVNMRFIKKSEYYVLAINKYLYALFVLIVDKTNKFTK